MWYEINRSEVENRMKWNWMGQYMTDGEKLYRWFDDGDHQDIFTISVDRGGLPPTRVKLSEYSRKDGTYLYGDDGISGPIFLGAWTKCEYPNFNWLKGCKFFEVDVEILTEDGSIIPTCRDPVDGGMAILVGSTVVPIATFSEGAVRICWFTTYSRG